MIRKLRYQIAVLLFINVLITTLTSCEGCKTTPNTSDTSPPTIDWTVQNKTQGTENKFTGNGAYTARIGDQLAIIGCANDDGGIKQLENFSNSSYHCISGNIGQNVGPGLAVSTVTPLGLDENGKAWKRYCAILNVTLNFACSSGFTFSSGNATAFIKATNYSNLSANSTLTVTVSR